jgi:2-dehydropantoate 2-reductase
LPFLNGVDAKERIEKNYAEAEVWDGCVYIMVRLAEPGVVKELGNIHQFYFGSVDGNQEKLKSFKKILHDADINAVLSEDIEQTIWDKFLLISTIGSLTSYLDLSIQEIVSDEKHKKALIELMNELKAVGEAKQITFSDNIIEKTVSLLGSTPIGTTSSMHSDFKTGGKTEYESLTEYVVKQGGSLNIETPNYKRILNGLLNKMTKAN